MTRPFPLVHNTLFHKNPQLRSPHLPFITSSSLHISKERGMKSSKGKENLPFSAKEINSMGSYFKIQSTEINIGLHMNYWRSMILATYHLKLLNFYVLLKILHQEWIIERYLGVYYPRLKELNDIFCKSTYRDLEAILTICTLHLEYPICQYKRSKIY